MILLSLHEATRASNSGGPKRLTLRRSCRFPPSGVFRKVMFPLQSFSSTTAILATSCLEALRAYSSQGAWHTLSF